MGVLAIGENPRAGIPNCLMNRASVVDAKISGLESFPPDAIMAFVKTDHQGFDSSVAVDSGRPPLSLNFGPFRNNCRIMQVKFMTMLLPWKASN